MHTVASNDDVRVTSRGVGECYSACILILEPQSKRQRSEIGERGLTTAVTFDLRLILAGDPFPSSLVANPFNPLCRSTRWDRYQGAEYLLGICE